MTELKCPKCASEGDQGFTVSCAEYVHYEHTGADWSGSRTDDDAEPIERPDLPYRVTCCECGHEWTTEPFS